MAILVRLLTTTTRFPHLTYTSNRQLKERLARYGVSVSRPDSQTQVILVLVPPPSL